MPDAWKLLIEFALPHQKLVLGLSGGNHSACHRTQITSYLTNFVTSKPHLLWQQGIQTFLGKDSEQGL